MYNFLKAQRKLAFQQRVVKRAINGLNKTVKQQDRKKY